MLIRALTSSEENSINSSTTVHVDLALMNSPPELIQLFHLLMYKIDCDWPWVIGNNTQAIHKVYRYTQCRTCLGKIWRMQPFSVKLVNFIVHKLAKQVGLKPDFILTSTHRECLENVIGNSTDGLGEVHTLNLEDSIYEYNNKT